MDLARRLKQLAGQLGVQRVAHASAESIKRSIERWEAGGRPDDRYWLLLGHAYATSNSGKVDLGPGSDFDRLMSAFELMGLPQRRLDDLRETIGVMTTAGAHAFLSHLTPELQGRLSWALEQPDRLDTATVRQLQQTVAGLRHWREGAMPAVRLLLAVAPLAEAIRQLRRGSQPAPVRQGLCTVAVQAFTFAGSLSFDLRDPQGMHQYYLDAEAAGGELRDGWLQAFALSARGMIALHGSGDFDTALELVERACQRAADSSSRIMHARSRAILAEVVAATGDARRSGRELGLAKHHVDRDGDDPAMSFLGETRHGGLDGIRAHIYGIDGARRIRLKQWRPAQHILARAVEGFPAGAGRQRAIILADLALTCAKLGDMEQAAALLRQAITLTATAGGAVPTQRIYQVRRAFDPLRHALLLRDVNEQLHAAALLG
jgi:tetratricopeptide (TPR) repeat protein